MLAVSPLALTHLVATVFMVGLIWFVQVVHYPLFVGVGESAFVAYEERHRVLTSWVVGLPMAVEGVTTVWLFLDPPSDIGRWLPFVGGVLLTVVLGSTVFVQVPMHERLSSGFDATAARRLVRTNWIRTVGWTARALLALLIVARS